MSGDFIGPWEYDPYTKRRQRIIVSDSQTPGCHDVRVEAEQEVGHIIDRVREGEGACGPLHRPDFQHVGALPTAMAGDMMSKGVPVIGQEVDEKHLKRMLKSDYSKFRGRGKF